jgi:peroxiredoxin
MPRVELNKKAPEFSLTGIDGKTVSLSDFYGSKNVLLVFNRGFV